MRFIVRLSREGIVMRVEPTRYAGYTEGDDDELDRPGHSTESDTGAEGATPYDLPAATSGQPIYYTTHFPVRPAANS